jgi:hypothetical protein
MPMFPVRGVNIPHGEDDPILLPHGDLVAVFRATGQPEAFQARALCLGVGFGESDKPGNIP